MMPGHGLHRTVLVAALSVLTGITVWGVASGTLVSETLLPHPFSVWEAAAEKSESGLLWESIGVSLWRVGWGWILGVGAGIITGLILGELRGVESVVGPIFEFLKGVAPF